MNKNFTKIAKVLGNFDFVKTQALMKELDWNWTSPDTFEQAIPTVYQMVDMAHKLLVRAGADTGFAASGGFEATFHNNSFTLKFVIEESSDSDSDAFAYTSNLETVSEDI